MAFNYLKKGSEAKKAFQQEEEKAELRKQQYANKVYRLWIPPGKDTAVTFLDGDLDDEGNFDTPAIREHQVFMNKSWKNWYVCTSDEEPCPICETADKEADWVQLFTVIDHSQWKDAKGNLHKDEIRLVAAKRESVKHLTKLAIKRGGLAGCRFDVSRTGDKEASIGNIYDFTAKFSLAELQAKYGKEVVPLDYEKAVPYLNADQLRTLGFGNGVKPVGSADSKGGKDYGDLL